MFTIGEEQFQTLKEFDQALRALDYPHTVWVAKEQLAPIMMSLSPQHIASDESGVFLCVGLSRVRSHPGPALDTMDNPKWRKDIRASGVDGEKS